MNKPITAPPTGPQAIFYAISGGQVIYEAPSSVKVAAFIARKRAAGNEVACGANGATAARRQQRAEALEQRVEVETVGYRVSPVDAPGLYVTETFLTGSAAAKHRAEILNDPKGEKYDVKPVNWRHARFQ